MSQELIGKESFKKVRELITDLKDTTSDTFSELPVYFADERERLHKIDKVEMRGKSGLYNMSYSARCVIIKGSFIHVTKESKVEIALNRSEGDLSKYQEAIRKAAKCSSQESVNILEEINKQDFLLLSGKDCRKLSEALEKKEKDIEILRESLREKKEVD